MIRYNELPAGVSPALPLTEVRLKQAISTKSKTWLKRAKAATATSSTARKFVEAGAPSWSDIKSVFMTLQHSKCAYCERFLEGNIENDIEHYRPKKKVKPWSPGATISTGGATATFKVAFQNGAVGGYYLLALEPRNYCASCKYCNSTLKGNYFPIAGRSGRSNARDLAKLNRRERPLLPYPIGDLDTDPEEYLGFEGIYPVPLTTGDYNETRALTTIHFFQLGMRERLLKDRLEVIKALWRALEDLGSNDPRTRADAETDVTAATAPSAQHTNFARCFVRLFQRDQAGAHAHYQAARRYIATSS